MKKILLINPPRIHRPSFNDFTIELPLGVLSMAAFLRRNSSVRVFILDCLTESFEVNDEGEHIRYGMSFQKLNRRVTDIDPDIIGIAFPFSSQSDMCLETVETVKKSLPHIPIIAGGPHATVAAHELIDSGCGVDICVIGEGELTLAELVDNYNNETNSFESLNKIKGIAYKDNNGEVLYTRPRGYIKNLDELPYPAYDLVDMDKYLRNKFSIAKRPPFVNANSVNMITSRGCPHECIFCSIHLSMGKRWRAHSTEYIIKHIEFLIENYNVEYIHFEDDNFTFDVKRFDIITDMICEKKITIGWDNQNGMRADNWTYERLLKAKESGCSMIVISIESGVQEVLDKIIKKRLKLSDVTHTIELCKKVDLPVIAFFVIGIPGETIDQIKKTILFALKLYESYGVDHGIMVATPFYGTRLYNLCKKKGFIAESITSRNLINTTLDMPIPIIRTPLFGPEDIRSLSKWYLEKIDTIRQSK